MAALASSLNAPGAATRTMVGGCSRCTRIDTRHPRQQQWGWRRRLQRRCATVPGSAGDDEGSSLASEFQSFVNQQGLPELLRDRQPTHLMSPLACVAAQMDALQRNDWPETDAGVQTAFMFSKREGAEQLLSAQAGPHHVRSWAAREEWLSLPDFSNQLHSPPYSVLLGCDSWQPASELVFPSDRHKNKAVCAVAVTPAAASQRRQQLFTFCLERVLQGPLKNVWLTVGVRDGDYANS